MSAIIGLWLNQVPESIIDDDYVLRELINEILQGWGVQKMTVAGRSLLITLRKEDGLPRNELQNIADNLRKFLGGKFLGQNRFREEEFKSMTLSAYDDVQKWKTIIEEIRTTYLWNYGWYSKPLEKWKLKDTLRWLTDNKLSRYSGAFWLNDIDGPSLLELNETDLRDLGIWIEGHFKTFKRLINEAKAFTCVEEVAPEVPKPSIYENIKDMLGDRDQPKDSAYNSVIVSRFPESLLNDADTLFDIENLAFFGFALESFNSTEDSILVTFQNPLTLEKREELRKQFVEVMRGLRLDSQLKGALRFDFCNDGKIVV